jgi:hypothetical protein
MKRVKFYPEGRGRTRFLAQPEAKNILAACNPDFRDVVLMATFRMSKIGDSDIDVGERRSNSADVYRTTVLREKRRD